MISEKPMIAFNGVRNSWLIFAKKRDLALLPFSPHRERAPSSMCATASDLRRAAVLCAAQLQTDLRQDVQKSHVRSRADVAKNSSTATTSSPEKHRKAMPPLRPHVRRTGASGNCRHP